MAGAQGTEKWQNWWGVIVPRANRIYFAGLVATSLLVLVLPHVLGRFIPCAEYMDVDWLVVALLSIAAVGALNITFAFMPLLESYLPERTVLVLRGFLVVVLPCVGLIGMVWFAVGAFVPALMNDPELLCD
jgi:hypothetical protein